MEQERKVFIYGLTDESGKVAVEGCVRRGVPEDTAKAIFSEMESFASYAFNKSHAACYALISYQTAYLKKHFPCPYFAALLTSVLDQSGKVAVYIDECARHGIRVIPPHVNESDVGFAVYGSRIRFGLMAVKNLGRGLIEKIIRERQNGRFVSFFDFCSRMYGNELNRRALESLIRCGALDGLGANRRQMLLSVDTFLDFLSSERSRSIEGQLDLFGMTSDGHSNEPTLPVVSEFPPGDLLEMEKQSAGLYLTGHPLSEYDDMMTAVHADRINDILANEDRSYYDGKRVDVFAIVGKVKLKTTKNGQQMAFVDIEDKYGSMEMIVFPNTLAEFGALLQEGSILRIAAVVNSRDEDDRKLICDTVQTAPKVLSLSQADSKPPEEKSAPKKTRKPGLYLRVRNNTCREYVRAVQVTDIFDGTTPLYIYFMESKTLWQTPASMWVDANGVMLGELKKRLGDENVALVR